MGSIEDLRDAAYQRERKQLPNECCEAMRVQFAKTAFDTWRNGFWPWDGNVELAVDGEWKCDSPLLFCPFCGKQYEFEKGEVRHGASPGVS